MKKRIVKLAFTVLTFLLVGCSLAPKDEFNPNDAEETIRSFSNLIEFDEMKERNPAPDGYFAKRESFGGVSFSGTKFVSPPIIEVTEDNTVHLIRVAGATQDDIKEICKWLNLEITPELQDYLDGEEYATEPHTEVVNGIVYSFLRGKFKNHDGMSFSLSVRNW